jgi:hypothetical protein
VTSPCQGSDAPFAAWTALFGDTTAGEQRGSLLDQERHPGRLLERRRQRRVRALVEPGGHAGPGSDPAVTRRDRARSCLAPASITGNEAVGGAEGVRGRIAVQLLGPGIRR